MELKVKKNCFIMRGLSNHSNIYIYKTTMMIQNYFLKKMTKSI